MSEETTLDNFADASRSSDNEQSGRTELRIGPFLFTLPTEWDTASLSEACENKDGDRIPVKKSKRREMDGEIPYYGASGKIDTVDDFLFDEQLLLLAEDGANLLSRNSRITYIFDGKLWVNNHAHVLKPKRSYNIWFLSEFLELLSYEPFVTGTAQPKLTQNSMSYLDVPKPPLSEQRKMATVLYTVDRAIEKTEEIINQTKRVKKGIFQKFISAGYFDYDDFKTTRIGGKKVQMPEEWTKRTLSQHTNKITDYVANGSFADIKENVEYKDEEDYAILLRLVDYSDDFEGDFVYISEDAYNYLSKSKVNPGDIILSNIGANLGTVFKAPELGKPMSIGPNALLLKSKFENDFLYYWLDSDIGQKTLMSIVGRTAQKQFSKTDVRELEIPVPPLQEQKEISRVMSDFDNYISKNEDMKSHLSVIKEGLRKDLLTGTVRTIDTNIELVEEIK